MNDQAPEHLLSTLQLVERAYPDGVPHTEYLALLFVLSDHMCDGNLAFAATFWNQNEGSRLDDVLAAKHQMPEAGAVLQKLVAAGFVTWIEEE